MKAIIVKVYIKMVGFYVCVNSFVLLKAKDMMLSIPIIKVLISRDLMGAQNLGHKKVILFKFSNV